MKRGGIFAVKYLKEIVTMGTCVQTAMIIDDDADLSELLATILENRKIQVLKVHTLWEAEKFLSYLKPTVVFLDNSFPEGMGINFIKNIKSADDQIKIIMMTGDSALWIKQKAIEEGINFFLSKPFSKKIIDVVLDMLKLRRA